MPGGSARFPPEPYGALEWRFRELNGQIARNALEKSAFRIHFFFEPAKSQRGNGEPVHKRTQIRNPRGLTMTFRIIMRRALVVVFCLAVCTTSMLAVGQEPGQARPAEPSVPGDNEKPAVDGGSTASDGTTLWNAQSLFYTGRYEAAADAALRLRSAEAENLTAYELRTSALLFQLKGALDGQRDKDKALKLCAACPQLMAAFQTDTKLGQDVARSRLRATPGDDEALFFLGKLDLNHVWLHLGTLGRKTGWDEYWEARRSLDTVLKRNPRHVRALVARAWIDYIVDTRMPWGTGWLLGGGNKKKALRTLGEAVNIESDFFVHAEAEFALWDIHVRERNMAEATTVARRLGRDFPDNLEVAKFLERHDRAVQP
jgi:tetratricopeptide (TPR) repeat protein